MLRKKCSRVKATHAKHTHTNKYLVIFLPNIAARLIKQTRESITVGFIGTFQKIWSKT